MKFAGVFLLVAGWLLVLSAVALLPSPMARAIFVCAGLGVEAMGLALLFRSHLPRRGEQN